jgi:hypothetical protein
LNEGGRLLFPLVGSKGGGLSLLLTRPNLRPGDAIGDRGSFAAKVICYCRFIACRDAYDPAEEANVTAAFYAGLWNARSLIRNDKPDDKAVLIGKGWWLSK